MTLDDMFLKTLSDAAGVSGDEDAVRKLILKAIQGHMDEIRIDTMGNLIATKKGTGAVPLKVMAAAHMDEVGFMVVGFESNGLLKIRNIGGIDARILPALQVEVGAKRIPGVIPWKPIHLNKDKNVQDVKSVRVDIGADSKGAAEGKVSLGDRVVFATKAIQLSPTTIRGKAFDDRTGCAILVELCQGERFPFDFVAAFTVQEEVGLRGASVLAEAVRPDAALVLETTACHELPQNPDAPDHTTVTGLGQGPALSYMDRTSIAHPGMLAHFRNTGQKLGIPFQFRSPQFAGGTDAGVIHMSLAGIPTLTQSTPCRYIHSPYSILNLEDYHHGVQLARQALMDLTPEQLKRS
jgi:endoglucanase